jgi:TfoX/Sxy family transcriptional regulator of competence genes
MPTLKKSAKKTTAKASPANKATKSAAKKTTAMPTFSKSPPELMALFGQIMAALPMAETRKMFGYPAGFANGQMFASLFGDNFILRLPEPERELFIKRHSSRLFEPMPGRPMKEYVVVPPALLKPSQQLDDWLAKALAYAQSLPPKTAKAKRK